MTSQPEWLQRELAWTAKVILGTAPEWHEGTAEEAHAAGVLARSQSPDRVAPRYRSWDLQRAFIAGWNKANADGGGS